MKKITFIASHLGFGGIEKCLSNVTNMLIDNYEIEIVTLYKTEETPKYNFNEKIKITYLIDSSVPKEINQNGIMYYFKKINFIKIIQAIYIKYFLRDHKLKKYFKKNNTDILISTHLFMTKNLKSNKDSYKIHWEHNHHNNNEKYLKQIYKSSKEINKLLVVSKELVKYYQENKNIKCTVNYIPNFVDTKPSNQSKLNNKTLISVGRLSKEKGYLDLIEIMYLINNKDKNIKLHLIGSGSQEETIRNNIKKYSLENYITMHGFLSPKEIENLYQESSLYVMTSHTESFGLVLLEAMNSGLPCIAFDSAQGARELIDNNKNGILIQNRDIKEMSNKIIELLNDKEQLKKLKENNINIINEYSKEKNNELWKKLIEEE